MSDKFDEASKNWAKGYLAGSGINYNSVLAVTYEVVHETCYCGEYCYCTRDDEIEVTIAYKVAGIAQSRHLTVSMYLGSLLDEVFEW